MAAAAIFNFTRSLILDPMISTCTPNLMQITAVLGTALEVVKVISSLAAEIWPKIEI